MKSWIAGLVVGLIALSFTVDADAQRRLGGGKSFGRQSAPVQQKQATPAPAPQAAPAQQAAPAAAAAKPAAPAAKPSSPWKGALLGAAAGLGLMALASALGFGEGMATLMLVLLAGVVIVMVVGFFMRRSRAQQPAYQGASQAPINYNNVGYETSPAPAPAPLERSAQEPVAPAPLASVGRPGSAMDEFARGAAPAANFSIPADFDIAGFIANAKSYFGKLQTAWDTGNVIELGDFTTQDMFIALTHELRARGATPSKTEIVTLEAELLGIESSAADHLASVKFDGTLKIDGEVERVNEVWNLVKSADGKTGWLLAGIQQLS
ncbi:MAG: TIM44-like domain-containing protein [Burkholderiaceae bacterium]